MSILVVSFSMCLLNNAFKIFYFSLCFHIDLAVIQDNTVNKERFAGLNFHGFYPMKLFTVKLSWCITFKAVKQCH